MLPYACVLMIFLFCVLAGVSFNLPFFDWCEIFGILKVAVVPTFDGAGIWIPDEIKSRELIEM